MAAATQPIKRLTGTVEMAQGLARVFQIGWLQGSDRFDNFQLHKLIELVELQHALFGKCNLIHGEVTLVKKRGLHVCVKQGARGSMKRLISTHRQPLSNAIRFESRVGGIVGHSVKRSGAPSRQRAHLGRCGRAGS